jgi:hypothetical protein
MTFHKHVDYFGLVRATGLCAALALFLTVSLPAAPSAAMAMARVPQESRAPNVRSSTHAGAPCRWDLDSNP